MVVLGGLEIAAVGYLLNEFNKDKIEERERRKHSQNRPDHSHHDRPHNDRPSRPHSNSRPPAPAPFPPQQYNNPQASNQNLLFPPQNQMRPSSAPPPEMRPDWQRPQQQQPYPQQGQHMPPQYQPQQIQRPPQNGPQQRPPQGLAHELPGDAYPFQSQLWGKQQAQQAQQQRPPQGPPPNQGPNQPPLWQPGPQPGPQGPHQFNNQQPNGPPPQYNNYNNGPPPPGPGHLQRPQTFNPGQQPPPPYQTQQQGPPPQPYLPQSQTFPIPNQLAPNQPPSGPLMYINTKTGKVSHNLYPVDHPMHRSGNPNGNSNDLSLSRSNNALDLEGAGDITMPREFWDDEKYIRAMAGDVHTGMLWSERDEDDLAYGKDYSADRERRKKGRRGTGGGGYREQSYERVRRAS